MTIHSNFCNIHTKMNNTICGENFWPKIRKKREKDRDIQREEREREKRERQRTRER